MSSTRSTLTRIKDSVFDFLDSASETYALIAGAFGGVALGQAVSESGGKITGPSGWWALAVVVVSAILLGLVSRRAQKRLDATLSTLEAGQTKILCQMETLQRMVEQLTAQDEKAALNGLSTTGVMPPPSGETEATPST